MDRRNFVRGVGVLTVAGGLAGCSGNGGDDGNGGDTTTDGGSGGDGNTVAVGPDGQLVFEPEEITVETGETVTWEFKSASHNVSAWPDDDGVSIPDGAEGFGTMEKDGNSMATVGQGETFEHTFETAGEYTYVCVPHVSADMIGTVIVE